MSRVEVLGVSVGELSLQTVVQRDKLLEALKNTLHLLERADCSTGYCCCGNDITGTTTCDGHVPVDVGSHYQNIAIASAYSAIAEVEKSR